MKIYEIMILFFNESLAIHEKIENIIERKINMCEI